MSRDEKDDIAQTRAIDYFAKFIDRRTSYKGDTPEIAPKSLGDKVILLSSGTGSGKSTTIAPFIFNKFRKKTGRNIVLTQPKILTAVDKSQDIARHFSNLIMGYNIGYHTGTRSFKPKTTGITVMTTGILLNILTTMKPKEFARSYSFIIVDEIHERDINTETLLFLIKKFLVKFWEITSCPMFILMSATMDETPYMSYFGIPPSNFIEVEGRTFPIVAHFPKYDVHNYITFAIRTIHTIHVENLEELDGQNRMTDILVFVKDKTDATAIIENLHVFNATIMGRGVEYAKKYVIENKIEYDEKKTGGGTSYVLPILLNRSSYLKGGKDYRNMFSDIKNLQVPVFGIKDGKINRESTKLYPASRKIIVSTPLAETGITIPTLKYCIDTGWALSPEFNPDLGAGLLLNKNITQDMANQRKGRVGRLSQGECYPCYTKETYEKLPKTAFPKFVTQDITDVLLNIIVNETHTRMELIKGESGESGESGEPDETDETIIFKKFVMHLSHYRIKSDRQLDFRDLDFFMPPTASGLGYSLEKLFTLGFINHNYNPTILGLHANKLPKISLEYVKMIFSGYAYDANILDLVTISAFLTVEHRNIFGRKYVMRSVINTNDVESAKFYNRTLVSDEFIDYIFVWNEFLNKIGKLKKVIVEDKKMISMTDILSWCDQNSIKYDGLLSVSSTRDMILESLISIGINPYYNGLGMTKDTYNLHRLFQQNIAEGLAEVKKIKRCILDGFRCNLARWNKDISSYEMFHKPAKILVKSPLVNHINTEEERPKYIVLSHIMYRSKPNNITYVLQSLGAISVMDGFVDIDMQLMLQ